LWSIYGKWLIPRSPGRDVLDQPQVEIRQADLGEVDVGAELPSFWGPPGRRRAPSVGPAAVALEIHRDQDGVALLVDVLEVLFVADARYPRCRGQLCI